MHILLQYETLRSLEAGYHLSLSHQEAKISSENSATSCHTEGHLIRNLQDEGWRLENNHGSHKDLTVSLQSWFAVPFPLKILRHDSLYLSLSTFYLSMRKPVGIFYASHSSSGFHKSKTQCRRSIAYIASTMQYELRVLKSHNTIFVYGPLE